MRNKKLKLSAVLLLGLGLINVQAQTMNVKESSGTQTDYALSNIQMMTFSGGNTTIQKTDNSTVSFALNELSYISFTDLITSSEGQIYSIDITDLTAYPNPVSNLLSIDLRSLKNQKGLLSVISLEGNTVLTQQTQGTSTEIINLSELETGVYYCQFTNENETKTVRIIKY